jgi:hypothetical protein
VTVLSPSSSSERVKSMRDSSPNSNFGSMGEDRSSFARFELSENRRLGDNMSSSLSEMITTSSGTEIGEETLLGANLILVGRHWLARLVDGRSSVRARSRYSSRAGGMTQSFALSRANWGNDAVKDGSSYRKAKNVRRGKVANINTSLHILESPSVLVEWRDDKNLLHR